jgi:broad specificity phosphatase PhoE
MKDYVCIYLVRHGQTDYNVERRLQGWRDVPLNEKGFEQANRAAEELKDLSINAVYSSPILRAMQTAKCIAEPHKLEVVTDKGLGERNEGTFTGLTMKEIEEKHGDFWEMRKEGIDWRFPEGESMRETIDRALAAFEKIAKRHKPGERAVIVSHGAPLRGIVHLLHGGEPENVRHTSSLDNAEIVEVHWGKEKPKIVFWKSKI